MVNKTIVESVHISEKGKQQLIRLKRKTGIEQWNTLCRWAFCLSLAETSVPPKEDISADSNIDMTWKTFSGQYEETFEALLKQRMIDDNLPIEDAPLWFRIHLHRGISYLNNNCNNISSLTQIAS